MNLKKRFGVSPRAFYVRINPWQKSMVKREYALTRV